METRKENCDQCFGAGGTYEEIADSQARLGQVFRRCKRCHGSGIIDVIKGEGE